MKNYKGVKGGEYFLVQTPADFDEFIRAAYKQPVLAVDTETSGLDWVKSHACGLVFGWGPAHNYYLPINHKNPETGELSLERQLNIEDIRPAINKLLGKKNTVKIFWNAKFDLHVLRKLGIEVDGPVHDGLVLAFLLDENGDHSLKGMSNVYISSKADAWETMLDDFRVMESKRRRREFLVMTKEHIEVLRQDPVVVSGAYAAAEDILADQHVLMTKGELTEAQYSRKRTTKITSLLRVVAEEKLSDHYYSQHYKADISYDLAPLDILAPYAAADVHYTWVLWNKFLSAVESDADLHELYLNEMELLKVLFETEHAGVKIDAGYLKELGPKLEVEIVRRAKEVYDAVGYKFNIASPDELVKALLSAGCKLTKLTKAGQKAKEEGNLKKIRLSCDKEVLAALASKYEFAQSVHEYRKLEKLKSTYVDGILAKIDSDSYVHTTLNQNVRTGRMSSSGPNCQNIPANDKRIRVAFIVPGTDYIFVFIDYSQVELRLTAHYSEDPELMSCYPWDGEGKDVHSLTCADIVMGIPYEELMAMKNDKSGHNSNNPVCECNYCTIEFLRTISKRVNFGIIYGAGAATVQRQVSTPQRPVSEERVKLYIDGYFNKYSGVRDWVSITEQRIRRKGFVQNAFGRYRRFHGIRQLRGKPLYRCYRQGVNFLIQGTAADLFKQAITKVDKVIQGTGIRLVNVVHDEIQFYFPRNQLHVIKDIKGEMEDFKFKVPLVADVSYSSSNWAEKRAA